MEIRGNVKRKYLQKDRNKYTYSALEIHFNSCLSFYFMQLYITHLKQIFENIVLLYRNFLHWNISKIYVFLYSNIVGFIASLPFIGILIYQYTTSYSKLGISISAEEFLLSNMITVIVTLFVILCILTIFICTYTYGNFLMQNVYKFYLTGEKLAYTKNLYFSGKHFRTYIGILGWISLYSLAPIVVGFICVVSFWLITMMGFSVPPIVTALASLTLFIILLVWFVYLIIRLIFAYYILLYSEEVMKSKFYIDESFRLTRKKVWKIISLIFPFLLIIGILASITQTGEELLSKNRVYNSLLEIQSKSGQDDHKLLEGFFNGNEEDKLIFGKIEKTFTPMNNGIDKNFL